MPSFSNTLEQAIHSALALANSRSHEFATLEHLLLALIDEPDASRVMKACSVETEELRTTLVEFIDDDLSNLVTDIEGPLTSMSWIPRTDDADFPFSVTIHGNDPAQFPFPEKIEGTLVGMGLFVAADPRPENRIVFDEDTPDWKGLPSFSIHAPINEVDAERIEKGKALAEKIAHTLGAPVEGFATTRVPTGSSLHYQGTLRMGEVDDGTSVCDRFSRVWGFENLHVAGNGVIPTVTATNPTPFIVALASIGAAKIAAERRTVARATA